MKQRPHINRREFLTRTGSGAGALALSALMSDNNLLGNPRAPARQLDSNDGLADKFHHTPKAKSVIWLFMNGGPSGIDLFDQKVALDKWDGKRFPGEIETLFPHPGPIMKSPFKFKKYGESGVTVSEVFPQVAKHVDDMTFIKACGSEAQNHAPACYMVNSGMIRVGAPCVGSWATYGLGTENQDLPGFVVMYDHRSAPEGGANLWDSAFLPGEHQGVTFQPTDNPILYLKRPQGVTRHSEQERLYLLQELNRMHLQRHDEQQQLQARIKSFETAFRMQMSAPKIVDVSDETEMTKRMYGLDEEECRPFGSQLLMARRMVEQGVRFIQIYHGGWTNNWDQHSRLERDHRSLCYETDRPIAGLLQDLKQRGLLDDTLVIWGGEFGRTPTSQDRDGRDHNPFGFTMWMAGGGSKPGLSYGMTDELGYKPVENPVSMHDLHATILHLMGVDHERLSFRSNGRDQTLTNNLGDVVRDLIA